VQRKRAAAGDRGASRRAGCFDRRGSGGPCRRRWPGGAPEPAI